MRENERLDAVMRSIEDRGDVILIGGAVRDIALKNKQPRDFDMIVCCKGADLQECMKGSSATKNRFGGYKMRIDDRIFDIWSIEDHWPVKKGIINEEKEQIADGAFYNIDAICINLSDNSFVCEGFNDAMRTMQLDIPLKGGSLADQPHVLNIVRAYRIKKQWNLLFSDKVKRYIGEWIAREPHAMRILNDEALRHFGDTSFLPRE